MCRGDHIRASSAVARGRSMNAPTLWRFESGYRPETHLQNSEKLQSPKIAPPFRHRRPYIRLRRNFPRPSPCKRACRPPGGETEPTPLRGASRLGRMGDYPSQQKRHAIGVPFLLAALLKPQLNTPEKAKFLHGRHKISHCRKKIILFFLGFSFVGLSLIFFNLFLRSFYVFR